MYICRLVRLGCVLIRISWIVFTNELHVFSQGSSHIEFRQNRFLRFNRENVTGEHAFAFTNITDYLALRNISFFIVRTYIFSLKPKCHLLEICREFVREFHRVSNFTAHQAFSTGPTKSAGVLILNHIKSASSKIRKRWNSLSILLLKVIHVHEPL